VEAFSEHTECAPAVATLLRYFALASRASLYEGSVAQMRLLDCVLLDSVLRHVHLPAFYRATWGGALGARTQRDANVAACRRIDSRRPAT
jgi:hypothetical protein